MSDQAPMRLALDRLVTTLAALTEVHAWMGLDGAEAAAQAAGRIHKHALPPPPPENESHGYTPYQLRALIPCILVGPSPEEGYSFERVAEPADYEHAGQLYLKLLQPIDALDVNDLNEPWADGLIMDAGDILLGLQQASQTTGIRLMRGAQRVTWRLPDEDEPAWGGPVGGVTLTVDWGNIG